MDGILNDKYVVTCHLSSGQAQLPNLTAPAHGRAADLFSSRQPGLIDRGDRGRRQRPPAGSDRVAAYRLFRRPGLIGNTELTSTDRLTLNISDECISL